jgi:hypothetical protein
MKDIVIFDIDGTLANGEHRQQYVREKPKNWPRYNDLMSQDTVHEHVWQTYHVFSHAIWPHGTTRFKMYDIYILSGREDRFREVTEKWLLDNDIIGYKALYMRKAGDYRSDDIVKEEILDTQFKDKIDNILCVFDDRPRVIRMWRRRGIPVFDCGLGVEF